MRHAVHSWVAALVLVATSAQAGEGTAIDVSVRRVPFQTDGATEGDVGRLRFRGGLSLSSPNPNFGGISGLIVSADGTVFLAVTDRGYWVKGQLVHKGARLHSVENVKIAPILGQFGNPLERKADADAEGLTPLTPERLGGDVLVSFEQRHRVERYPFGRDGFNSMPTPVTVPQGVKNAPSNGGLEAIVLLEATRILAISEQMRDESQNIRAWILPLDKGPPERLSVKRIDPYAITDIAELPSGDLITVERRFGQLAGVGAQLRVLKRADIVPGAAVGGEVVASMGMSYVIDNMEGISARQGEMGETLIYLISDDNFNRPLQQTLLLLFELRKK